MLNEKVWNQVEKLREEGALVHNITNYVTVNDCANMILASGASPIMADAIEEVEEIISICSGLNLNIGTLNERTIKSMLVAGKKANELKKPVVLDPVGAGASSLRTKTANQLIEEVKFRVIRGNISEIKTLCKGQGNTKGVDADSEDEVTTESLANTVKQLQSFAKEKDCIIVVTGEKDIIVTGESAYIVENGHRFMSRVTGTGCMLSALLTSFISRWGIEEEEVLLSVLGAMTMMGIAGEMAYEKVEKERAGNASYRNYIIDAICSMSKEEYMERVKVSLYEHN